MPKYQCPHCGGKNVRVEVDLEDPLRVVGICEDCQARGGLMVEKGG